MLNFERSFRNVHCDQQAKLIGRFARLSQADFVQPPNHARRKTHLYTTTGSILLLGQRPCIRKGHFWRFDQPGWDAELGTTVEETAAYKSAHAGCLVRVDHGARKSGQRMSIHK